MQLVLRLKYIVVVLMYLFILHNTNFCFSQVPQLYKLLSYNTHNFTSSVNKFVPKKPPRELRIGAEVCIRITHCYLRMFQDLRILLYNLSH